MKLRYTARAKDDVELSFAWYERRCPEFCVNGPSKPRKRELDMPGHVPSGRRYLRYQAITIDPLIDP